MKCPKCGYLGFEQVDRCRNCQYDFSLTSPIREPDFAIRRDTQTAKPLDDLPLATATGDWLSGKGATHVGADLDRIFGAPEAATEAAIPFVAVAAPSPLPREELPLFGPPIPDDEPLITKASPPRPPLAVRRGTPEVARLRAEPALRTPSLDLQLDEPDPAPSPVAISAVPPPPAETWNEDGTQDAGVGARFLAVMIDLLILAIIDAAVVYFTMQLCYLTIDDLGMLPKGPLVAFLLVQNGGYLVAFTAGGQTLGKMVAGIRVVQSDPDGTLDLGRAFLRTLMWVALAVPAGLGFLSALFSRDHRGLHDRFAGTRVVRASA
jgi:uncharacterized RDD family membrane protein YckC